MAPQYFHPIDTRGQINPNLLMSIISQRPQLSLQKSLQSQRAREFIQSELLKEAILQIQAERANAEAEQAYGSKEAELEAAIAQRMQQSGAQEQLLAALAKQQATEGGPGTRQLMSGMGSPSSVTSRGGGTSGKGVGTNIAGVGFSPVTSDLATLLAQLASKKQEYLQANQALGPTLVPREESYSEAILRPYASVEYPTEKLQVIGPSKTKTSKVRLPSGAGVEIKSFGKPNLEITPEKKVSVVTLGERAKYLQGRKTELENDISSIESAISGLEQERRDKENRARIMAQSQTRRAQGQSETKVGEEIARTLKDYMERIRSLKEKFSNIRDKTTGHVKKIQLEVAKNTIDEPSATPENKLEASNLLAKDNAQWDERQAEEAASLFTSLVQYAGSMNSPEWLSFRDELLENPTGYIPALRDYSPDLIAKITNTAQQSVPIPVIKPRGSVKGGFYSGSSEKQTASVSESPTLTINSLIGSGYSKEQLMNSIKSIYPTKKDIIDSFKLKGESIPPNMSKLIDMVYGE